MNLVIPSLLMMAAMIGVLSVFGGHVADVFEGVRDPWTEVQARSERQIDTRVAGPKTLISTSATSSVRFTLTNEGNTAVTDFPSWDMILEIQKDPGLEVRYLTYTASCPSENQWTVRGIYLATSTLTLEVFEPGVLNPGEKMVVLARPSGLQMSTYDRATLVTPDGIPTPIIFQLSTATTTLHVVDETDSTVYRYRDDGTYLGSSPLTAQNSNAKGITTDGAYVWTTDGQDDLAYVYTSALGSLTTWALNTGNSESEGMTTDGCNFWTVNHTGTQKVFKYSFTGGFVSDFSLDAANDHATGVTTDGTSIWVVDHMDKAVYKYSLSGAYDSSFALDGGQSNPRGIATDGKNIWVADRGELRVYKYTMDGTFVSSFALTGDNAAPEGITVTPR